MTTGLVAGTTAAVMRGGKVFVQLIAVDAFGNALGQRLAAASSGGSYRGQGNAASPYVDPDTGEHIILNGSAPTNDFASINALMGPTPGWGNGGPQYVDRSGDVLVAAGDRLTLTGVASDADDDAYYAGIIAKAQARDLQRNAEMAKRNSWIANENATGAMVQRELGNAPIRMTETPMGGGAGQDGYIDSGSNFETGLYSDDPGSIDYYRQSDGLFAIEISGLGNGNAVEASQGGNSYSAGDFTKDVAIGAAHAVVDTFVQPGMQVRDLGFAAAAVGYNELIRPFTGGTMWMPEMMSGIATSYARGSSQGKLLAGAIPVLNVGVFSYDTTAAVMDGRYQDAARSAGGFLGGMAVGVGAQRYGSYGVQIGTNGLGSGLGNLRVSLVHPNLLGNGQVLAANMGGIPTGYQAHHLIMSQLAPTSKALTYLAEKGLYDINAAPNGRAYPGNPLSAADANLPLHSGYHGKVYRNAVANELAGLDDFYRAGASDAVLLREVGAIQNTLASRLESGSLWLNAADAFYRGLSK